MAAAESALIVQVRLPRVLERFRMEHDANAARGVPAHVTLIYPFMPPGRLDVGVRESVVAALASQPRFELALPEVRRWPGVLYLAVAPIEPFERMVRSLQVAFPEYPPYGGEFPYVPHVTLAEGDEPEVARLPAPSPLPPSDRQPVTRVLLIAQGPDGRWRPRWRFGLRPGGPGDG